MRVRVLAGLALVLALGCGSGKKIVPVSGQVTLNGTPLAHAVVSFQPVAEPGALEAGPGSAGITDESGNYSLKTTTGQNGAQIGRHQVRINCLDPQVGSGDARPPRGGWPMADRVPPEFNKDRTFDVPRGGTDQANFDIPAK